MVVYKQMSGSEAQAYQDEFLAAMPARLERLRAQYQDSGSPAADLDLSVESLIPLWDWVRTRLSWRSGSEPADFGRPQPLVDLGEVEPESELPEWYGDWPERNSHLSAQTMWLIDWFGRYYAETIRRAVPGAAWSIGRSPAEEYEFRNHPVLQLPGQAEFDPIETTVVFAQSALNGREDVSPYDAAQQFRRTAGAG